MTEFLGLFHRYQQHQKLEFEGGFSFMAERHHFRARQYFSGDHMSKCNTSFLLPAVVLATGIIWGIYWLPVRELDAMGFAGAWGTVAITLATVLLLLPFVLTRASSIITADRVGLLAIALGGVAFALYSIGFVYGRVAIIILLWFLSPVWSTLIGKLIMGWPTPRLRIAAIIVGLFGLFVMMGGDGGLPIPKSLGEWMSLAGGVIWAFATTGMRTRSDIKPVSSAFVFALGALSAAIILAPVLEPLPVIDLQYLWPAGLLSFMTGGLWWGLSLSALMWATVRIDPTRVSILLMSEVLIGALSAAYLASEHLSWIEIVGGSLVMLAGILEIASKPRSELTTK
ncbi:MAG: DMT family transporter [Hyphomicrobiales bacterium]